MANIHRKTNLASNDIKKLANTIVARLDRPLALVGLMGSGKSAVGRQTAKKLGLNFTDSDQKIINNAGISIAEIFELAGEAKFREMEFQAITKLVLSKASNHRNRWWRILLSTNGTSFINQNSCCMAKGTTRNITGTHWQH